MGLRTHNPGALCFPPRRTVSRHTALALALAILGLVAATAQPADARDPRYLADLIERADQARLSQQRQWHLLLHYRKAFWGGFVSEADDPGFFLSPVGKTDPRAELDATLA